MARDEKVVIRLTEEVKKEFQGVAESMGMTISSLGSYVIGDYLRRLKSDEEVKRIMAGKTVEYMSDISVEKVFDKLDEEKVLGMLEGVFKGMDIRGSQTSSEG